MQTVASVPGALSDAGAAVPTLPDAGHLRHPVLDAVVHFGAGLRRHRPSGESTKWRPTFLT